jgi:hypothetical protein
VAQDGVVPSLDLAIAFLEGFADGEKKQARPPPNRVSDIKEEKLKRDKSPPRDKKIAKSLSPPGEGPWTSSLKPAKYLAPHNTAAKIAQGQLH